VTNRVKFQWNVVLTTKKQSTSALIY